MKNISRLYIDASRLKSGGGILHLKMLLKYIKYSNFDFIEIFTYKNSEFKNYENKKIKITTHPLINSNIFLQIFWQKFVLPKLICNDGVLFSIDSTSFCRFKNTIILNQDIIGFQPNSLNNFKLGNRIYTFMKYIIAKTAIRASIGSIFTTEYARKVILRKTGHLGNTIVIPHGINNEYLRKKENYNISDGILNLIYVSPILDYKNHKYLIKSINELKIHQKIEISFVGGGDKKLIKKLKKIAISNDKVKYNFVGFITRDKVSSLIRKSDIAFFLSSVECFGITLLEYMRIGMPIICSDKSSLPETIGNTGLLVDPMDNQAINNAIYRLISDKNLRIKLGENAYQQSKNYDWKKSSALTYKFLYSTFLKNKNQL